MVRVKVFPENRYFPEMLFSRKENVFMCLVVFQKMFRKIFSDVWLCSWKYHRKNIFYLLLTFSQLPNEYIISFIPKNTNKTQNKSHFLGEIAICRLQYLALSWMHSCIGGDMCFKMIIRWFSVLCTRLKLNSA